MTHPPRQDPETTTACARHTEGVVVGVHAVDSLAGQQAAKGLASRCRLAKERKESQR